ncbi:hypothetical protein AAF712_006092 [Marasmius tenuissimus]|uniref:L-tryptophan decarboxylase PsiD-like domain-containing protein n=1 Tax=Marasmius tenuissimus TaxID=585030 RepID=A0ABR3A2U2_9AGAR|nr:hypothetical protein PM082_007890 [Marasmius tenuissimus]
MAVASQLEHYHKLYDPGFLVFDGRQSLMPSCAHFTGYLPREKLVYQAFFDELTELANDNLKAGTPHLPVVERFKQAIEGDKLLYDLFQEIFLQVDPKYRYSNQVKDWEDLLCKLDVVLAGPPKFCIAKDDQGKPIAGEPVGVPIYLMFDLLINTSAGSKLFQNHQFNVAIGALLNTWGEYLTTPDSSRTLNTSPQGWFSPESVTMLESGGRGAFHETYHLPNSDPDKGYGFTSWDHFFVRTLKEPVSVTRPIHDNENPPSGGPPLPNVNKDLFIHHACESTVVRISENVQLHDRFWLKAQPYSLYDMLNGDPLAEQFIGGAVYQTFLSPQDYHRWHSPVNGTIEKAEVVYGTYYSALPDEGVQVAGEPDHRGVPFGAYLRSQPWLTFVATRALIWIRAKNPKIGLLCFIGIGMVEVSTCDIKAAQDLVGKEVKTGQEIGMFHFGGSGHCLVFRKDAQIKFDFPEVQTGARPGDSLPQVPNLPPIEKRPGLLKGDGEEYEQPDRYAYIYGTHLWVNSIIGYSTA